MCAIYADLHKNVTILMSRVLRDDSLYGGQIDGCDSRRQRRRSAGNLNRYEDALKNERETSFCRSISIDTRSWPSSSGSLN